MVKEGKNTEKGGKKASVVTTKGNTVRILSGVPLSESAVKSCVLFSGTGVSIMWAAGRGGGGDGGSLDNGNGSGSEVTAKQSTA